ncbi:MAG TPA: hypothetical protein VMS00_10625, partial [Acidimicrobiales bacterium]|nr:hypothetical protein [Acidimicrobiales bacterium]
FLVRVEVLRRDKSLRQSTSETMESFLPIFTGAFFSLLPKRLQKGPFSARDMAKLLRTAGPQDRSYRSFQVMIDALVGVVEARTELELVGSPAVRSEASKLIAACMEFSDIADSAPWPWQKSSTMNRLDKQRALVVQARDSYIAMVKASKG